MTSPEITDAASAIAADVMGNDHLLHKLDEQQADEVHGHVQEAVIRHLSAALAAGVAPGGWQAMDTAPKDGREVLGIQIHNGRFSDPGIVMWDDFEQEWWDIDADQFGWPTHWQPLVAPGSEPAPSALVAEPGEPVSDADGRRPGNSKLVYNKATRTIDTVRTAPPARQDGALREALDALRASQAAILEGEILIDTLDRIDAAIAAADAALAQSAAPVQPEPSLPEQIRSRAERNEAAFEAERQAFRLSPVQQAAPSGEGE